MEGVIINVEVLLCAPPPDRKSIVYMGMLGVPIYVYNVYYRYLHPRRVFFSKDLTGSYLAGQSVFINIILLIRMGSATIIRHLCIHDNECSPRVWKEQNYVNFVVRSFSLKMPACIIVLSG